MTFHAYALAGTTRLLGWISYYKPITLYWSRRKFKSHNSQRSS